jgi:tRNA (guanine37-N1)-methyltransferase
MTDLLAPCRAVFAQDPVRYLDVTEAVRRGGRVLAACPTGALVSFRSEEPNRQDPGFTMFAQDRATAERLCGLLPPAPAFLTVHEDFIAPLLEARFGLRLGQACWQVGYRKETPPPLPASGLEVRQLDLRHLATVSAHYPLGDDDYLTWLLERGALYGAFSGGALCGFMGVHIEGSMGLLEVLPQYRRRGVATLLQAFLTRLELQRGHTPYGQVFDGNLPSLALQERLGFQRSQGQLYWATRDE